MYEPGVPPARAPDPKLAATAVSRAQPEGKPRTVANGPTPAACPRLFVVHAPEDAWFIDGFLELGAVIVN